MGFGSSLTSPINMNSSLTLEQQGLYQDPQIIAKILNNTRTIAIVGLSTERQKASYFVATYLRSAGYRIIPVNPRADEIFGERSYPNLASIPEPIDLVDIFRPSADCLKIVEEAITCQAKAVWLQLKIINLEAAERARKAGLLTVMDLCVKMEHGRYSGGLHEAGMNTEIISAKRIHRYI
ncbi:CoA-binding protein [Desulfitobacterium sp. Sab5]|uniref:CoA-binding protein n=1 Tax=Desulfitobacterium nosdiversum TaxID=3375356 RepID=UPI003CF609C3